MHAAAIDVGFVGAADAIHGVLGDDAEAVFLASAVEDRQAGLREGGGRLREVGRVGVGVGAVERVVQFVAGERLAAGFAGGCVVDLDIGRLGEAMVGLAQAINVKGEALAIGEGLVVGVD